MKQMKRWIAILCSVILLCSLMSVGAAADNGLELFDGEDVLYLSLAAEITLMCSEVPAGVDEEKLVWSVGNKTILKLYPSYGYGQAVGTGETTVTVATRDGKYTDTVKVVVSDVIPMTSNSANVFLNPQYPSRTFSFVPDQTGYYEFRLANEESYIYGSVYDADLVYAGILYGDATVEMTAGEMYYLSMTSFFSQTEANTFSLTYIGKTEAEIPDATAICFEKDSVTMTVGDVIAYPAYHFEPEGAWNTAVTYSVDDDTLLLNDEEMWTLSALAPGTATVTITSENGLSDMLTVVIEDDVRVLTMDTPITIEGELGDTFYADFTAPEAGYYSFYSVSKTADSFPYCAVYDADGNALVEAMSENGNEFRAQVLLEKDQTVTLELMPIGNGGFDVYAARPTAATGVELAISEVMMLSQNGDTVYISPNYYVSPTVRFIGAPNAFVETYELTAVSDDVEADEDGYYYLEAGQTVTFTVVTESGLTDTVIVKAIGWVKGDIDMNGEVGVSDVAMMVQYLNGASNFTAQQIGAMELNGDNRVTLLDAMREFYYVNGQLETL